MPGEHSVVLLLLIAESCWTLLRAHKLSPLISFCLWDFPGESTGVGCHFLLQGILLTQGSNLSLPHCRKTLLPSEPPGKSHNGMSYCADWMTWHSPQIRIFVLAFTSSQHHTVYLSIFPKELGTLSVLLTALSQRLTHTQVLNQFWLCDHIKDVETDAQKA